MGVDMSKIEISINGKDIDLNPFVEEIITNTIKGCCPLLGDMRKAK